MNDYREFLEHQLEHIELQNKGVGISFPFLFKKNTAKMIAARLIKTKRDESLNVCWACLTEDRLTPNGIFFSADESEWKENIHVMPVFVQVSKVCIIENDGIPMLYFMPTNEDLRRIFREFNAVYIRDKRELK